MTWHAWNALHDLPDPIPVNDDVGKSVKANKPKNSAAKKPESKTPGKTGDPAPKAKDTPKAVAPSAASKMAAAKPSFLKRLFG